MSILIRLLSFIFFSSSFNPDDNNKIQLKGDIIKDEKCTLILVDKKTGKKSKKYEVVSFILCMKVNTGEGGYKQIDCAAYGGNIITNEYRNEILMRKPPGNYQLVIREIIGCSIGEVTDNSRKFVVEDFEFSINI